MDMNMQGSQISNILMNVKLSFLHNRTHNSS